MKREMRAYYRMHKLYDLINFIVCFVVPLAIITVLYTFICLRLWRSQAMLLPKKSSSLNGILKSGHVPQVSLDVQDNLTIHQPLPSPPEIQTTSEVGAATMTQQARFLLVMAWRRRSLPFPQRRREGVPLKFLISHLRNEQFVIDGERGIEFRSRVMEPWGQGGYQMMSTLVFKIIFLTDTINPLLLGRRHHGENGSARRNEPELNTENAFEKSQLTGALGHRQRATRPEQFVQRCSAVSSESNPTSRHRAALLRRL